MSAHAVMCRTNSQIECAPAMGFADACSNVTPSSSSFSAEPCHIGPETVRSISFAIADEASIPSPESHDDRLLLRGHHRIVNAVEKKLERAVRLRALQNLGAEQENLPGADARLGGDDAVLEILLTPRPATAQRCLVVEPGDGSHACRCGVS